MLKTCCFCFNLRTGGLIIGYIGIISSILFIILEGAGSTLDDKEIVNGQSGTTNINAILTLIASCGLIYGIYKVFFCLVSIII